MSENVITFSFGANWKSYLKTVTEDSVRSAKNDLACWLGEDNARGKTVLDIGSGSGIHSLSFYLLGAKEVLSFDHDPNSVEATRSLWEKAGRPANWKVLHGSILDKEFVRSLRAGGGFDIVYSWGVLHHTGAMWEALENASQLVSASGRFFIALYSQVETYQQDLALKRKYNRATMLGKKLMAAQCVAAIIRRRLRKAGVRRTLGLLRRGRLSELENPFAWNRREARGMSAYHDLIDWLGGLPYEVAGEGEVIEFARSKGFLLERLQTGEANSVYLFSARR